MMTPPTPIGPPLCVYFLTSDHAVGETLELQEKVEVGKS